LRFNDYGTNYITSLKVPPDSWAQIAIQISYFRLHKKLTAIYETGSTRAFNHGRTDTVRSLTEPISSFIKSFDDPKISLPQKLQFFMDAVSSHRDYLIASVRGEAIDRHFLGLRLLSASLNLPVPLFSSFGFQESQNWRLSTSNMNPSDYWFCGFGPVVDDGYGVCYCIRPDHFKFSIANFVKENSNGTDSSLFREILSKTLYDMRDLVLQGQNSSSKL